MQKFLNKIIPFFILGFVIVAFAFGLMILFYLLLFGTLVGLVFFIVDWINKALFPKRKYPARKQGRTFDSDEWRKL